MTAMPAMLSLSVQFAQLPAAVREEVTLLDRLFKQALAAPAGQRMTTYRAIARQLEAAGYKGTVARVRSLLARYSARGCDWRELVDKRRLPHDDEEIGLPPAFQQEVKKRFDANKRSAFQAHDQLIKDWRRGVPMPGYRTNPAADPFTGIPRGWSYENLKKKCKRSAFEETAMKIGLGAARAKHGPKMFNSRVGCHPFQFVLADDVDNDNFVYVGTNRQVCRVSQIGLYELLSGHYFCYGTQPQLKRIDPKTGDVTGTRMRERHMRYVVAMFLYEYGYSPLGTTILGEHGTATLRGSLVDLLHDRTGGLVRFDAGGWTGKEQAVPGMFSGRGGGNPRHKAAIESFHNLLHNKLGALPGQTGPDVERRPEELHGRLQESSELMRLMKVLPPYIAEQLKFPLLEYSTQFLPILHAYIDEMNRRTHHNLEGWAKLRFLTSEYRFHRGSEEWLSEAQYLALPPGTQAALAIAAKEDPACMKPRNLSPHEVFEIGRPSLVKAPIALIAELLYADLAEPRACKNSYFEWDDRTIDSEPLRFESRIIDLNGRESELPDDTYEVVLNPFQYDQLWIYSGKRGQGSFLGRARRAVATSRADRSAGAREVANAIKRTNDQRAPLLLRHANIPREETQRLEHNLAVIAGPRSEAEARVVEMRAEATGDLTDDDFTDQPNPEPPAADLGLKASDFL